MKHNYQITEYCHRFLEMHLRAGDVCVDATAGNGNDTEFLCRICGEMAGCMRLTFRLRPSHIQRNG